MITQTKFETIFQIRQSDADSKTIKWLQILLGSDIPVNVFVKCVIPPVIKAENLDLPSLKSNVFKKSDKTRLWQ